MLAIKFRLLIINFNFQKFKKEGFYLAAMTPLGVPEESELKSPPRKPIDEIMTVIE